MGLWFLHILLSLLSPSVTLGQEINMCNGAGTFPSPVLSQKSSTDNSSVCSCTITYTDYNILLKNLQVKKKCKDSVMVSLTTTNTTSLDLLKIHENLIGSYCLLGVGSRDSIPSICKVEESEDDLVIQTLDNLLHGEHLYLQIMSTKNVTVNCSRIAKNDSLFDDELKRLNLTEHENETKGDNKSEICVNPLHDDIMMNVDVSNENSSNAKREGNTTLAPAPSDDHQLEEYRKRSERMMTASLVMLPFAGLILIISILILAAAYRRKRGVHRIRSKRTSASTRRPPAKENPSYYEEVDEEFHIRMSSTAEVTDYSASYELATRPDPCQNMPNNLYTDANHISVPATPTTDDGEYNVASHSQLKNLKPNIIDSTYDLADQSCVVDLDETEAEGIRSPEVSTATCTVHTDALQLMPLSESSPDQGDNLYSLEKTVSPSDQTVVDTTNEKDTNIDHEEETDIINGDPSDLTDILDAEIYANFSSLQSEGNETTPKVEEKEDDEEEDIYMNQKTVMDKTESPDLAKTTEQTGLKVPKPKPSGYINVQPAEMKDRLSPGILSTTDSEEEIYQNSPVGVGSTASLISTNSEPQEEPYESYAAKQQPASANSLEDTKKKNTVEVVLLTHQADKDDDRGKKNYGHSQSKSVDESSNMSRRIGSKRRRPKSDHTLLLDTSGSEEDALVMVNNLVYEGTMMASPKKKNCNHPEPQEELVNYDDQGLGMPLGEDDDDDDDDDLSIMVQNDLYESFNCGGVSILTDEVSKEMKQTLAKKNLTDRVNESANVLCEKM